MWKNIIRNEQENFNKQCHNTNVMSGEKETIIAEITLFLKLNLSRIMILSMYLLMGKNIILTFLNFYISEKNKKQS